MAVKIALAGNPNSGKTTLFNALTGANQYVGNWPGVTVEKKEGRIKGQDDVILQDLPGIYSLSPYTLEEVVARDYLVNEDPYYVLDNARLRPEDSLVDMKIFKEFGGQALVECTTDDFGRDPVVLKDLAQKSGLNVIMGCGHYIDASLSEEVKNASIDTLTKEIIDDITVGVRGTGIKAGVIGEVGTSMEVTDVEWKNVTAAAIASKETGASIQFHTALWGRNASAIIKKVKENGGSAEKVCIGHIDVALRPDYLYEILDQGAYVEFDNIGKEFYVPKDNQGLLHGRFAYDLERADVIADLVKRGYADKQQYSL